MATSPRKRGTTIQTNTFERKGAMDAAAAQIIQGAVKVNVAKALQTGDAPFEAQEIAVEKIISPDQIPLEAFMAQELEIHLMDAATEDEPQFVEVNVNGHYRMLVRGETHMVRRYHVAVLAQAKDQRLQQKKIVNADGSMGFEEKMVSRQMYPFSIVSDPAGRRGAEWIKQQLANAR